MSSCCWKHVSSVNIKEAENALCAKLEKQSHLGWSVLWSWFLYCISKDFASLVSKILNSMEAKSCFICRQQCKKARSIINIYKKLNKKKLFTGETLASTQKGIVYSNMVSTNLTMLWELCFYSSIRVNTSVHKAVFWGHFTCEIWLCVWEWWVGSFFCSAHFISA